MVTHALRGEVKESIAAICRCPRAHHVLRVQGWEECLRPEGVAFAGRNVDRQLNAFKGFAASSVGCNVGKGVASSHHGDGTGSGRSQKSS